LGGILAISPIPPRETTSSGEYDPDKGPYTGEKVRYGDDRHKHTKVAKSKHFGQACGSALSDGSNLWKASIPLGYPQGLRGSTPPVGETI